MTFVVLCSLPIALMRGFSVGTASSGSACAKRGRVGAEEIRNTVGCECLWTGRRSGVGRYRSETWIGIEGLKG